jgi:hypothetical protein
MPLTLNLGVGFIRTKEQEQAVRAAVARIKPAPARIDIMGVITVTITGHPEEGTQSFRGIETVIRFLETFASGDVGRNSSG